MRLLLLAGFLLLLVAFFSLLPKTSPVKKVATPQAPLLTKPLIRAEDPRHGNPAAPVTLVEFGDFACPACKEFQPVLHEVLAQFPESVLHVWRDFPLPQHPLARRAHVAAQCANAQGKFWEFHDRVFAAAPTVDEDHYAIAAELALNIPQFTACLQDATILTRVEESFKEGRLLGITETPYLFINETRVAGIVTKEELVKIIQKELTN